MPAKSATRPPPLTPLRVSVPEACGLIGLSRPTLYKLIKAGRLRPVKEGKRTLFTMRELERYCALTDSAAAG